jgi:hypothetical protein
MHNTCVWQIYFQSDQHRHLDPGFSPLNNVGVKHEALEFNVFDRLWQSKETHQLDYWGAVSWRFAEKTGLSSTEFFSLLRTQPQADVYFMNPFPKDEALFENSWIQGEISHPGLLELVQAIFALLGIPSSTVFRAMHSTSYSLCNFFVGNNRFWSAYIPHVQELLKAAEARLPPDLRNRLHTSDADWRGLHNHATYIPFIVERIFPVFMLNQGQHLKSQQIRLPRKEALLPAELRDLRELKNLAVRTRSSRLLTSWRKQRYAYVNSRYHPRWCDRFAPFLESIPTDFDVQLGSRVRVS